jgi:hypothetical protein
MHHVVEQQRGTTMDGFDDRLEFLQATERQTVLKNMKEIAGSSNPLYIGKRIGELQVVLAPYGYFSKAISALGMVMRTAYGYMYGYRNAAAQLPAGAVQAMIDRKLIINASRNRDSLGEWTEAVALVPPPATGSAATYSRWVEEMMSKKKKRLTGQQANRIRKEPDEALLDCYRFIERMGKRLPPQPGTRERFARHLIRLTMKHFDLKPEKFTPAEIPASFAPARNRFS